ncbi:hypothetical protein L1887_21009 [Cichorium endivia]|nr:hypothetical protein L1887_21009 [Cichorium endivia]
MGKVGVLTSRRKWINEELTVEANGKSYKIGVVEYTDDWSLFRECPFDKTKNFDDEEDVDDEEDSDGISDTWVGMDEDEPEEGEIIPNAQEKDTQKNSNILVSTPSNNPVNLGRSFVDDLGIDNETTAVGTNEEGKEESGHKSKLNDVGGNFSGEERAPKATRDNKSNIVEADSGVLPDPTRSHSSGPNGCGLQSNEVDKEAHEVGRDGILNAISRKLPAGCFGPFSSRAEPYMGINYANTPSSADSSKSSVGRVKRRRIKNRRSTEAGRNEVANTNHKEKSFDLNNQPQVRIDSPKSRIEVSSRNGGESQNSEVQATYEVGKEIGFQFDKDDATIEQIMGGDGGNFRNIQ